MSREHFKCEHREAMDCGVAITAAVWLGLPGVPIARWFRGVERRSIWQEGKFVAVLEHAKRSHSPGAVAANFTNQRVRAKGWTEMCMTACVRCGVVRRRGNSILR